MSGHPLSATIPTNGEIDRLLAEQPYVVDLYGIRERRPGEPVQRQMSSEARWDKFETEMRQRRACGAVARFARAVAGMPARVERRAAA